jgi:hypothetical protein
LEIVILSFPVPPAAAVEINIFPPFVPGGTDAEPRIVQLVIVLLVASLVNLIVLVPEVADLLKFEIVRKFPLVFRPLNVTLSAPYKLIIGAPATVPEIVLAPLGTIISVVHAPALRLFSPNSSVISDVIVITILAPDCTPPFIAEKAPPVFVRDVYVPFPVPVHPVTVTCASELFANNTTDIISLMMNE